MGILQEEYWSGLPCPPPGDLPDPGIELGSPALHADSLPAKLPGKARVCVSVLSRISRVRLFATLWTIACQAPLPMGFSRQEYWSGLTFPPQGIFPTHGSNPRLRGLLHWQAEFLPLSHLRSHMTEKEHFHRDLK